MDALEQLRTVLGDRYLIEREIGAGGMATVYLARDLKHNRRVAVKVLRPELGSVLGPDRFLAEIKVTANLQHPHLLALFDSGEAAGLLYYVMPFVEGESLRDRLTRERQLPVDDAIRIAVAVASALEYAHRQGVVHRDLKPENILLQDGQPIVADFGIALAVSNAGGARITQTGITLGTPEYMSPEQATGDRAIDARSDIYSLAAVTYEMLTGEPPHTGNTVQAIIARLLTETPQPVRTQRPSIPEHVEAAVLHGLERLPADRFASADQFADALTGARAVVRAAAQQTSAMHEAVPVTVRTLLRAAPWLLLAVTLAVAILALNRERPALSSALVELTMPDNFEPITPGGTATIALSRDGSQLAFVGRGPAGEGIYLRAMNGLDVRFIPGTEGATVPVFSPDGNWLLFFAQQKRMKVQLPGGPPIAVGDLLNISSPASWSDRDEVLTRSGDQLWRVPVGDGKATVVAAIDTARGHLRYGYPHFLPGGKAALITVWKGTLNNDGAHLGVLRLRDGRVTELGIRGSFPLYVAAGFIVFGRSQGTVFAAPFSLRRLRVTGSAVPVLQDVDVRGGAVELTASATGILVFKSSVNASRQLVRVGRNGVASMLGVESAGYSHPRVAPDARRIAIQISAQRNDIWTYDLATRALMPVTTGGLSSAPEWSPDGQRIAFTKLSGSHGTIASKPWDGTGTAEVLVDSSDAGTWGIAFGPVHSFIALGRVASGSDPNIWIAPADSPRALRPFLGSPARESAPRISPNGNLIAYVSDESGRSEVYVQPLPGPGSRVPVSNAGGSEPIWSPDSRELFYRGPEHLMSAVITAQPRPEVVSRDTLFADSYVRLGGFAWGANYDVFPNGKEFVFVRSAAVERTRMFMVTNWPEDLRKRMNAAKR